MSKKINAPALLASLLYALALLPAAQAVNMNAVCQQYVEPVAAKDIDPENLRAEFSAASASSLRQRLAEQLKKTAINDVFPDAYWYRRSFETRTVANLYERVIFHLDTDALSFLIKLMQNKHHQFSTDAKAAVAFIHFQLNTPEDIKRGIELIKSAVKGNDSYPAGVFWGRALVLGGAYTERQLGAGMNYLSAAAAIPADRANEQKPFDKLNDQRPHTETILHLFEHVPEMPARQSYESIVPQVMEVMKIQQAYKTEYANAASYINTKKILSDELQSIIKSAPVKDLQLPEPDPRITELPLDRLITRQEALAQKITALGKPEQFQSMIQQVVLHNTALQQVLYEQQNMLMGAMMSSKEDFPKNIAPLKVLMNTQAALARSCSLEQSWNKLLK